MDITSSTRQADPETGGIRSFLRRHPLVCYFLMSYGFSWLAWLPLILSQNGIGLLPFPVSDLWGGLPGLYLGPLLSGILVTAAVSGKTGLRQLLHRSILWRTGWQWFLFIFLGIPALITVGTLLLPGMATSLQTPSLHIALALLPVLVIEILTAGIAEEPGWRGVALPRLQQRFGPLWGTLILGFLWGVWHLPVSLTGSGAAGTSGISLLALGGIILACISMSIVMTWVFNHTQGSALLAGILFHAMANAFAGVGLPGIFPPVALQANAPLPFLAGFAITALLLIVVTRGRLGFSANKPTSNPTLTQNEENVEAR